MHLVIHGKRSGIFIFKIQQLFCSSFVFFVTIFSVESFVAFHIIFYRLNKESESQCFHVCVSMVPVVKILMNSDDVSKKETGPENIHLLL